MCFIAHFSYFPMFGYTALGYAMQPRSFSLSLCMCMAAVVSLVRSSYNLISPMASILCASVSFSATWLVAHSHSRSRVRQPAKESGCVCALCTCSLDVAVPLRIWAVGTSITVCYTHTHTHTLHDTYKIQSEYSFIFRMLCRSSSAHCYLLINTIIQQSSWKNACRVGTRMLLDFQYSLSSRADQSTSIK